ncbi:MAG: tetratricopeptide repeat protein [Candidatus Omnitrophica bacterium]|nr:tetratricopeptide repeat protein [Candidatus Omnitrophota bacterium]
MLKKQIILYLLLTLCAIGETTKNYLKLAITSSEKGYFDLSNKYLDEYIASGKEELLDYIHLLYGYNLLNLEKYIQAIEKFEIIIKKFPLSPYLKNAYLFLISTYLKIKNHLSALKYYKEYKDKFGQDIEIEKQIGFKFLQEGITYFKNNNFQYAKDNFCLILEEFKDENLILWSNYYLGLIEFQTNNFENAQIYFEKVIISGKGEIYFDSKLKIGDCYFNKGEYGLAENYYRELIEGNTIFSQWAKFQIAMIEKRRGNLSKAMEILDSINYNEDINLKFNVLNEKVNIYLLLENYIESEKILNLMLKEFSDTKQMEEIYFKLGVVNFNKKEFDKSILFFKKSIEIAKEDSIKEKDYFFIGYINYIKCNFEESLNYWDILKKDYPKSSFIPQILYMEGKKFYGDNKIREAEIIFKEILEKNTPYYEESITYLIEILIKEKKLEEGEFYAFNFLGKKYDKYINFLLGKIYYLKQDNKKAKDIFENLEIENPLTKAELTYYLGDIYNKEGNIEKAKEKFIEVISLYPQFKEWKEKAEKSLKEIRK